MHIGVDATCWHNQRGYGRHARALLSALLELDPNNRYTFFSDQDLRGSDLPATAEPRTVTTARPTVLAASSRGRRSLRDMWRMGRAMSDPNIDVLLYPTVYSYVPVISRSKKIVMIHDVIAERFPDLTLPRRTARTLWNTKVALARWQASALVTVSEHARRQISQQFNVDTRRIHVVGEASDPAFRRLDVADCQSHKLRELGLCGAERTIVYVGGFNPHKNLEMLIDAYASLVEDERFGDVRLVLAGETTNEVFHSYLETIQKLVYTRQLEGRVIFTGFLADDELVRVLNLGTVLVLPSLLEGFGLPAVEAAACGLPVIATTESPLPELLGGGGLFVSPHDGAGWREALGRVLSSQTLRRQMSEVGIQAAAQLSWNNAARQLLNVIHFVANGSPSHHPRSEPNAKKASV